MPKCVYEYIFEIYYSARFLTLLVVSILSPILFCSAFS